MIQGSRILARQPWRNLPRKWMGPRLRKTLVELNRLLPPYVYTVGQMLHECRQGAGSTLDGRFEFPYR